MISAMDHETYADAYLRGILESARVVAVIGASPRPQRPSHGVMRYLQRHGYRAIPVNPFAAGGEILGERCYARLADSPERVDMADIFRRSDAAAGRAEAAGIAVVMNRCPAIEIPRLGIAPR